MSTGGNQNRVAPTGPLRSRSATPGPVGRTAAATPRPLEEHRLPAGPPHPFHEHRRRHGRELHQQPEDRWLELVHRRPQQRPHIPRRTLRPQRPLHRVLARSAGAGQSPAPPAPPPDATDGSQPNRPRSAPHDRCEGGSHFNRKHPGQHSPGIDTSVFNASSCLGPVVDLSRHSGADAWKRVQGDACAFGDP